MYGFNVFSLIFQSKFLNRMHILYEFKERCVWGGISTYATDQKKLEINLIVKFLKRILYKN